MFLKGSFLDKKAFDRIVHKDIHAKYMGMYFASVLSL